jgi:hypothetical protein
MVGDRLVQYGKLCEVPFDSRYLPPATTESVLKSGCGSICVHIKMCFERKVGICDKIVLMAFYMVNSWG